MVLLDKRQRLQVWEKLKEALAKKNLNKFNPGIPYRKRLYFMNPKHALRFL